MKKLSFLFVFAISLSLFQSCQKDTTDPTDPYAGKEAPQLPAVETFVMPFESFQEANQDEWEERTITNWGHSAANVLVWNTILAVNLYVPVLSFYHSFNHDPVYQGGGVWLWEYTVTDDTGIYYARLYGELLVTEEVKWDMYVSKEGGFTDVHWYSGIVAWDQSYANWTLNHNPNNPSPLISVNYVADNGDGEASITYTNIMPNNPGNGGYIQYREGHNTTNVEFDRAYDVYKIEIDNLLEIEWNSVDRHGRVKDFEKFGDTDWHCWGINLHDTQC